MKFVFITFFELAGIMMLILASLISYSHFSFEGLDSISIALSLALLGLIILLTKNFYLEREVQYVR